MPLEELIPVIDDRRFEQLLTEVRTRVARYTPEWTPVWTDLNDSDPGVTLAQVFAWLAEMLTYRMSKVPELNYIKFLQLIGVELRSAEPATAEVTFPLDAAFPDASLVVPMRTQVSAAPAGGGPPVVFETDRALVALKAVLASVQTSDGHGASDRTAANNDATAGFEPLGAGAEDGNALMLGFALAGPFPAVEVDLAFWALPDRPAEGAAAADTTVGAAVRCADPAYSMAPAVLRWEYWDGKDWRKMTLLKDQTRAFTRTGHVHLKAPADGSMRPDVLAGVTAPLYWVRARVERSQYARAPRLLAVRTNTVPVTQAETVRDEVLGGSNGRRDQVFRLSQFPVLAGSLRLEVDQGDGFKPWQQVDDFFASKPDSPDYVLDRTAGTVRFGDGQEGDIPVANPTNPDGNVVAREYRVGGGRSGNVAAGAIRTLVGSVDGVDDAKVSNLLAASGGRDEETLEEAKRRAPASIRSRSRAVTAEDYEYLARQAADVKRAKALPMFHPDFPDVAVPGAVTVIVVPDADPANPMPVPSDGTLRGACAYLDQFRLLTTELYVARPHYQRVEVVTDLVAEGGADAARVQTDAEAALADYLHPLRGGEDGQGWPFGGTVYFSRLYQRIFAVGGVRSIGRLEILLDGESMPECRDVPIRPNALVYSVRHQVGVSYDAESEAEQP